MKKYDPTVMIALPVFLLMQSVTAFAGGKATDNMFGVWGSLTLKGDFKELFPGGVNFKWLIMDQSRSRENGPSNELRYTENVLYNQAGYQLNANASVWLGYTHEWDHISPNKPSFQESRPYQDFLWNRTISEFKFTSRTRMEERINQTTGDTGYRLRQLVQIKHPLPFLRRLSVYVNDEILIYLNKNTFGKRGFSENRLMAGVSYQFNKRVGMDIGYLGQYDTPSVGNNLFIQNLLANISYSF